MRGADVIGIALLLLSLMLVLVFGVRVNINRLGSTTLLDLLSILPGVVGVACVIFARFSNGR